jgi:hypothetical protein
MPENPNIVVELTEIATELLVNELKRRAVARGMTTEELLAEAQKNWQDAETKADELLEQE